MKIKTETCPNIWSVETAIHTAAMDLALGQFGYDDLHSLCLDMGLGLDELYLRGENEYSHLLVTRMRKAGRLGELVAKRKNNGQI